MKTIVKIRQEIEDWNKEIEDLMSVKSTNCKNTGYQIVERYIKIMDAEHFIKTLRLIDIKKMFKI